MNTGSLWTRVGQASSMAGTFGPEPSERVTVTPTRGVDPKAGSTATTE